MGGGKQGPQVTRPCVNMAACLAHANTPPPRRRHSVSPSRHGWELGPTSPPLTHRGGEEAQPRALGVFRAGSRSLPRRSLSLAGLAEGLCAATRDAGCARAQRAGRGPGTESSLPAGSRLPGDAPGALATAPGSRPCSHFVTGTRQFMFKSERRCGRHTGADEAQDVCGCGHAALTPGRHRHGAFLGVRCRRRASPPPWGPTASPPHTLQGAPTPRPPHEQLLVRTAVTTTHVPRHCSCPLGGGDTTGADDDGAEDRAGSPLSAPKKIKRRKRASRYF